MSFKTQIEDLTGSVGDDSALTQWLTDGAKEIINMLPDDLKVKCESKETITSGSFDLDGKGEITKVMNLSSASGSYWKVCRPISSEYGSLSDDADSIYYATGASPVYWIESNDSGNPTLYVRPSSGTASAWYINYPSVANGDSSISNFPDEAEYLVVLFAAIKGLHRKMVDKMADLPADIVLPDVPVPPVLDSSSVSTAALVNPTFTPPTMSAPDFSDTNYWISTEEDPEMLTARVSEITAKISEYTARVAESQAKFNEENSILQKDLQVAMQNASTFEQSKLGKYSSELQSYQAEISSKISDYSSKIQKHSTDYQWLQAQYAQLKQDYSQGLQILVGGQESPE